MSDATHASPIMHYVSSKTVGHTLAATVATGLIGWLTPPLTFAALVLAVVWYGFQLYGDPNFQRLLKAVKSLFTKKKKS